MLCCARILRVVARLGDILPIGLLFQAAGGRRIGSSDYTVAYFGLLLELE